MGSHTDVIKNAKPNLWRESEDPCQSSRTKRAVTSTTVEAKRNVTTRAISSPSRSLLRNEREPESGPAFGTVVVDAANWSFRLLLSITESYRWLSVLSRRLPWATSQRREVPRTIDRR